MKRAMWLCAALVAAALQVQADEGELQHGPDGYEQHKADRGQPAPLRRDPMKVREHRSAVEAKNAVVLSTTRIDPPRDQGVSVEPVLASYRSAGIDHVIAAWHQIDFAPERDRLQIGAAVTHDGGASWQARVYRDVGNLGSLLFDPYAAADEVSGTLWAGALARPANGEPERKAGLFVFETRGNGALGDPRVIDEFSDDKNVMAFRRTGDQTRLVISGSRHMRWSDDLGLSFNRVANNLPTFENTGFFPVLHGDSELLLTAVAFRFSPPSSQVIEQVFTRSGDLSQGLAPAETIQTNNYTTLATLDDAVPGRFRMAPFGQTAKAANGTLYHVYPEIVASGNVEVLLIRSTDAGNTWSQPIVVNADQDARDQFHPALTVAPDGSVHVLYFDTRRSSQPDSSDEVSLDVVYAVSRDGGNSFAETFLTAQPFDATDVAWRPMGPITYFVGDYLSLTATSDAVYAAYPERLGSQIGLQVAKIANSSFAISPGITGAWYDPKQSGHGLFLEVLPDQRLLAWWFTFDSQGRPAWFGGVGTINGRSALIEDAYLTNGGRWIPNFNPADISNARWGRLRFDFESCTQGRVEFESVDPTYGTGFMDLTRLTLPAGLDCP